MRYPILLQHMIVTRQRQSEGDLHQFGGLKLHEPEIDPAGGAHARGARHFNGDQQQQGKAIGWIAQLQPDAGLHQRKDQQNGHAHAKAHHLARRPRIKTAVRRRIEHGKADTGDGHEEQHEHPVDLIELVDKAHAA